MARAQIDAGHSLLCSQWRAAVLLNLLMGAVGGLDFGICGCENGGVCLGTKGTLFEEDTILEEKFEQCLCQAGWRGYLCQEDEDECRSHPCVHGTCQDALGIPEYHCQCDGGFSGDNCETNDDDCASFPCMHGGSCLDGADTFMCVCAVGHTGEMCEVSSALDPVWRDVRGAYAIDPGQHVLLNPVSRVNVGIGLSKPREQLHVRGDAGSDSLTTSKLFVTTSAHGQSLIPVTEEDIFSLNTLLPK